MFPSYLWKRSYCSAVEKLGLWKSPWGRLEERRFSAVQNGKKFVGL